MYYEGLVTEHFLSGKSLFMSSLLSLYLLRKGTDEL